MRRYKEEWLPSNQTSPDSARSQSLTPFAEILQLYPSHLRRLPVFRPHVHVQKYLMSRRYRG